MSKTLPKKVPLKLLLVLEALTKLLRDSSSTAGGHSTQMFVPRSSMYIFLMWILNSESKTQCHPNNNDYLSSKLSGKTRTKKFCNLPSFDTQEKEGETNRFLIPSVICQLSFTFFFPPLPPPPPLSLGHICLFLCVSPIWLKIGHSQ